jgi:hypothetical protein
MLGRFRTRGAPPQLPSVADEPAPAESTRSRTSADRLKLATGFRGAPHLNSVDKAAEAFANFHLSRHGKDAVPPNYIDRRTVDAKDPAAVHSFQRERIARQLENVPGIDARNPGLTLGIPRDNLEAIAKSLPGLRADGGEVQLDDLLAYLRPRMDGTNVYSNGNPGVRRLTTEVQFRSAAQAIVDRIANDGAAQPAAPPADCRAGEQGQEA